MHGRWKARIWSRARSISSAGTIGVATRPKVVDFKERQRERKTANLRVLAMRIGIGAVVFALVIALIWLLFFSPALEIAARQDHGDGRE